jgi:F-type H+-transporting ATPase subunit epsilon
MAKKFFVEILTPLEVVLSENVDSIIVPAHDGYLGILADHAPMVCVLVPGELTINVDNTERHYAISGGFLEVAKNKVSILADAIEAAHEIDIARAESSMERALERLKQVKGIDIERARASLQRAINRIRIKKKYQG